MLIDVIWQGNIDILHCSAAEENSVLLAIVIVWMAGELFCVTREDNSFLFVCDPFLYF